MRCSLEVWPTYSTDIIREVNARLQVLEQTDTTSTHCTSRLSRSISEDHGQLPQSIPPPPMTLPSHPYVQDLSPEWALGQLRLTGLLRE
ncbi:unnamed protein product [Toxocara canis]|uniref:Uncharacterized protein n=1 Tax=Toxocara canis TaxID=6265 RepID=A0A183V911_TOXCA|nr:unnamed protein product [Toxocara canis]